ncbi:D-amino-acid transaminase [Marininema halotolerans]|uniref:D-alanine aminotransferase n=1 Tax=Marininema halotolerans TaxID=1155944 RepID=A0A1I6R481_9BACL|nr:D-alanine transaminase [Marininema halotolerans]
MKVLMNDQITKRNDIIIDIEDRGYQFGDGVYEVIRVYNGNAFYLQEHITRLIRSASELKMTLPYNEERLLTLLNQLVAENQLIEGNIYLQVSRGVAPRSHQFPEHSEAVLIAYTYKAARPLSLLQNGVSTILTEDIRWLRCDIKSLNLLGAVLAKQEAVDAGCHEAILHRNGTVTEGSSTNVAIIKEGTLYTHPADNLILHGITRQIILECANDLCIPVREETFTVEQLFAADEVFISSTTMEIAPVTSIDQKTIGSGTPGPLTHRLQQAFEEKIKTLKHPGTEI